MYTAKAMRQGQSAVAVELAEVARTGRLAIYAGAGLSQSSPTDMPSGAEVAERCYDRLVDLLDPDLLCGAEPRDLVSVANVVASHNSGDANHVRRTAVGVAHFTSATPNFGHEVLALLILEGVVVVITTNWDDCIERAGGEERIQAVISDQDRREVQGSAILKVHGCATRPTTVLVTSSDLEAPPSWARDEVNARLSDSHTVFVGIGDIAGYVRKRIEEAEQAIGTEGAIFVVAPKIKETWTESQWAKILPNLIERCRIATTSDEFLDDLGGAFVRRILRGISEGLIDDQAIQGLFDSTRVAFERQGSIEALRWLRCCATPRLPGTSVADEQAFSTAFIALGRLSEDAAPKFLPNGRVVAGEVEYEALVVRGTATISRLRREASERLVRLRQEGGDMSKEPTFLISGAKGDIVGAEVSLRDVLDDSDVRDIVGGPLTVTPYLVRAEDHAV